MSEQELRELIAQELEAAVMLLIRSNEYNFNDTAVRAKAFLLAADVVRGANV